MKAVGLMSGCLVSQEEEHPVLKLLGPALRKINVRPQDLDGATIAELTERCAQPLLCRWNWLSDPCTPG